MRKRAQVIVGRRVVEAARGEPPSMSLISSGEHGRRRRCIVQPAPPLAQVPSSNVAKSRWLSYDELVHPGKEHEPSFCVYAAL